MPLAAIYIITGSLLVISCVGGLYAYSKILHAMKADAHEAWQALGRPKMAFSAWDSGKNHLPVSAIIEMYRWLFKTPEWAAENPLTRRWLSYMRWYAVLNLITGLSLFAFMFYKALT